MYKLASKLNVQASTPASDSIIHPTVLTGPIIGNLSNGRGNQFISYKTQVTQAWKRYKNQAQYGNEIVRMVTKFRTGIICGNGANIQSKSMAEKKFIDSFLEINKLDGTLLTQIVTGTEIEGKYLIWIDTELDDSETRIRLKYLKWDSWNYTIFADPKDHEKILKVEFKDSEGKKQSIGADNIVYVVVDKGDLINEPIPPISSILQYAVDMGQGLADWRDMNHFWGSLGMHYESQDTATAMMMINTIATKEKEGGWNIGDVTAGPAKAYFPEPTGNGQESIGNEIDMRARIISGATGVPIHHLGWAKEMSNRATATELTDSILAHTASNKDAILDGIKEIIKKSVKIYNNANRTNVDYKKIDINITKVSSQQIKELIEVYFPLAESGYIHKDDVINRIPDIDPAETKKKLDNDNKDNDNLKNNQDNLLKMVRNKETKDDGVSNIA